MQFRVQLWCMRPFLNGGSIFGTRSGDQVLQNPLVNVLWCRSVVLVSIREAPQWDFPAGAFS